MSLRETEIPKDKQMLFRVCFLQNTTECITYAFNHWYAYIFKCFSFVGLLCNFFFCTGDFAVLLAVLMMLRFLCGNCHSSFYLTRDL